MGPPPPRTLSLTLVAPACPPECQPRALLRAASIHHPQGVLLPGLQARVTVGSRAEPPFLMALYQYISTSSFLNCIIHENRGFPGGSDGKASARNAGDLDSIPGSGRAPGEGNGNPLQYSCLENSMDGAAWWATVHGVAKSQTQLSDFTFFLRGE